MKRDINTENRTDEVIIGLQAVWAIGIETNPVHIKIPLRLFLIVAGFYQTYNTKKFIGFHV